MKNLNEKTQALDTIVPEYESGSKLVKWLFHKRLKWATQQVQKKGNTKIVSVSVGI